MTIDEKLEKILDGPDGPIVKEEEIVEAIAQIKKAFEEAGYIQAPELSGKIWLERFEKELDSGLKLPKVMDIWVRKCAQAAAGVKDEV